jgi:hypothetical protein
VWRLTSILIFEVKGCPIIGPAANVAHVKGIIILVLYSARKRTEEIRAAVKR